MLLPDWMKENEIDAPALAKAVGCSRMQAWRLQKRIHRPQPDLMDRIVEYTLGAVGHADLLQLSDDAAGNRRSERDRKRKAAAMAVKAERKVKCK